MRQRSYSRLVAVIAAAELVACSSAPCPVDPTDGGSADGRSDFDGGSFNVLTGAVTTIPLGGCAGPGYSAPFAVGTQTFQLTIDTGSGTLAVASDMCPNCPVSPVYIPDPAALDNGNVVSDSYLAGSWLGEVYTDSVRLVGTSTPVTMNFAAIQSQTGFFSGAGCAMGTMPFTSQGIVGFGPAGLAVATTDDFVAKAGSALDLFALEACPLGGQLMIGGVDPTAAALSGPAAYTPLTSSQYYGITLDDIQLSGASLGFGPSDYGVVAVDTGTSVLALPGPIFQTLASAIESAPAFSTAFGTQKDWLGTSTCVTSSLGRADLDARLPTLTLSLPSTDGGNFAVTLKATESYLAPTTSSGTIYYCSGILKNPGATGTILGTSMMSGLLVIFDITGQRVGFAPQTFCQ